MKRKVIKRLFCTFSLLIAPLAACSIPVVNTQMPTPVSELAAASADAEIDFMDYPWTGTHADRVKYAREKILNKKPYLGPVQVQVLQGLVSQAQQAAKTTSLDFTVQSIPAGTVVFQETFTKSEPDFEAVHSMFKPFMLMTFAKAFHNQIFVT